MKRITAQTIPDHKEFYEEGDYRAELGVIQNKPGSFCIFFESDLGKPRAGKPVHTQAPN